MRYGVLGTIRVERNGDDIRLHGRLRTLLAIPLCRAGAAPAGSGIEERCRSRWRYVRLVRRNVSGSMMR